MSKKFSVHLLALFSSQDLLINNKIPLNARKLCSSFRRASILQNTQSPLDHNPEVITPGKPNTNLYLDLGIGKFCWLYATHLKLSICFNTLLD